ncbi:hypothetical protein A4G99_23765 [Haladaptatus sp. R4]|uniref:DUF6176 family protein n=1 Tax=Haladaptatus sp. R4 TaxID=1679489 RepID=UPI0007B45E14|nr:DUF6176 family protein [Haladaptatus sp. R4]KZN25988.1 hypothetical protein A4G99_23765 [Haladaptatus sp. R4]
MTEIFVRKQKIHPGKTNRLRELLGAIISEAMEDVEGVLEIWNAETLQTLSLFIEHGDNTDYLVWYIEAEDMEALIEARETSTHRLHDIEDELMEATLESAESVNHFEPLVHGVNPNRSREFYLG